MSRRLLGILFVLGALLCTLLVQQAAGDQVANVNLTIKLKKCGTTLPVANRPVTGVYWRDGDGDGEFDATEELYRTSGLRTDSSGRCEFVYPDPQQFECDQWRVIVQSGPTIDYARTIPFAAESCGIMNPVDEWYEDSVPGLNICLWSYDEACDCWIVHIDDGGRPHVPD